MKRQTLAHVIRDRLEGFLDGVETVLKHYSQEPWRSTNLRRQLDDATRRTVEAVLAHLRAVEVEERKALELWEDDSSG